MLIVGRREISEYVTGFEREPFRDCNAAATIMSPLALPLNYTFTQFAEITTELKQ